MQRRRSAADLAGLAVVVGALVTGHLWWIDRHRSTWSVDVDEAPLLVRSNAFRVAAARGPGALLHLVTDHDQWSAPALSMTTAGLTSTFGRSAVVLLLPEVAALVVLLLSVWSVSRWLGAGRWALLAVALVGVSPGAVMFTRVHHQIVPGAAALALCVAVGLRTDSLTNRRWSIALGISVGAALLVRAMLLVIAPAAILAWLVLLVDRHERHREQWVNGAIALVTAAVVALPWWWFAGPAVIRYLNHGATVGSGAPRGFVHLPGWEVLQTGRVLAGVREWSLSWECLRVLCVGLGLALWRSLTGRSRSLSPSERYLLGVVAVAFAALVVSADDFLGFFLLVVPLLVAWGVARGAGEEGVFRMLIHGPALALTIIGATTFPSPSAGWYHPAAWEVPGHIPTGRATDPGRAYRWIVREVWSDAGRACPAAAMVVQPDRWIGAEQLQWVGDQMLPPGAVTFGAGPYRPTPATAAAVLDDAHRDHMAVILADPLPGDWMAPLPVASLARQARRRGFEVVATRSLPNGVTITVWRPPGPRGRCP